MSRQKFMMGLGLCAAMIACSALLSSAGSLEPPDGAVQPTMATLDQIDAKLNDLLAATPCARPNDFLLIDEPWPTAACSESDYAYTWNQVIEGEGTLVAIRYRPAGAQSECGVATDEPLFWLQEFRDGAGNRLGVWSGTEGDINIPFHEGLYARPFGYGSFTDPNPTTHFGMFVTFRR